jgi:hypothetical protein
MAGWSTMEQVKQRLRELENRVASLEGGDGAGGDDGGLLPSRKTGASDAQVLRRS